MGVSSSSLLLSLLSLLDPPSTNPPQAHNSRPVRDPDPDPDPAGVSKLPIPNSRFLTIFGIGSGHFWVFPDFSCLQITLENMQSSCLLPNALEGGSIK